MLPPHKDGSGANGTKQNREERGMHDAWYAQLLSVEYFVRIAYAV